MAILRDLHNNLAFERAISPLTVSDNTPLVSQIIPLKEASALEFVVAAGALVDADATFTVLVEHGDQADLSDAVAVDDQDLLGLEADASFQFDDDNTVRSIGYVGSKGFARLTLTPAANTGAASIAVIAVRKPLLRGHLG